MTGLCDEFGISRTTGYKIVDRYQVGGVTGLTDRSRRPLRPTCNPLVPCLSSRILAWMSASAAHGSSCAEVSGVPFR
jgi:hypothetical protein